MLSHSLVTVAFLFGLTCALGQDRQQEDEETLRRAGIETDSASLLEFFRKRTLNGGGQKALLGLIQQLGDGSFRAREKASAALVSLGMPAVPHLRSALKSTDIEVVRRAEECLRAIEERDSRVGLPAAAARLIAFRKPEGACEVLLAFLPFSENDAVTDEIQTALQTLAIRDGKPEMALITGLKADEPIRRGAAAVALCRAKVCVDKVQALLKDSNPAVRFQVASELATQRHREAIPVLVDLVSSLPAGQAWRAEEILLRLAGETAPTTVLGKDAASRGEAQKAWAAWWRDNAEKTDLAILEQSQRQLGYNLLVLLDAGQAVELGPDDKPRMQFEGLQFPLDVQLLPGERLLVAEHQADRVTERNRRGQTVWQKKVNQPLVAQRLLNGNTFIATELQIMEVDREGSEVFTASRPGGERIMKAVKRPNGEILIITSNRRFYRLDPAGKELFSFPVQLATSGGRLEVLPNGHILVPEVNNNRIVEFDGTGQIVWTAPFAKPLSAVRLPNGNTLVTAFQDTRVVELDRKGKEVWEYRGEARITRAFRR